MSTKNIGFYEDLTKIIFQLSSNVHLTSSVQCALLFQFQVKIGLVLKIIFVFILVASTETFGEHLYKLHSVPTDILSNASPQNTSDIFV